MKGYMKDEYWFAASVAGFAVLSGSFLLMPLAWSGPWAGIAFWLGLVAGIASQVILCKRCREYQRQIRQKNRGKRNRGKKKSEIPDPVPPQKPGVIRFFTNGEAKIADVMLGIGLLGTVVSIAATGGVGYVCYVFIGISVFSFCMHCILNGRVYLYVKDLMIQNHNSK